jgi:hypothetical protein
MYNILFSLLLLTGLGCQQSSSGVVLEKAKTAAYFKTVKMGYPVSGIERDLNLQPSEDHNAPSSLEQFWTVNYSQHGLVITFRAVDQSLLGNGSQLVYAGDSSVQTYHEYVEQLRKLGVPVR